MVDKINTSPSSYILSNKIKQKYFLLSFKSFNLIKYMPVYKYLEVTIFYSFFDKI